jgi:hypothetical protein
MTECKCGTGVPVDQKHCSYCGRVVHPKGKVVLVTEQPKPKVRQTDRSAQLEIDGYGPPGWESDRYFSGTTLTGRTIDSPKNIANRPRTAAQPVSSKTSPGTITLRVGMHRFSNGMAAFRITGTKGLPPVESKSFWPEGSAKYSGIGPIRKEFDAFIRTLNKVGWRQTGRGSKWYTVDMTKKL